MENIRRKAGRPKSEEKKKSIMQAASDLFLRDGYERTSMDSVAQEAGVSKQTVYGHFANKDSLFRWVIEQKSDSFSLHPGKLEKKGLSSKQVLQELGKSFFALVHSPESIGVHRILISRGGKNNPVAKIFHEMGPKRMLSRLSEYFQGQMDKGKMRKSDPYNAAKYFFTLVDGLQLVDHLLGVMEDFTKEEKDRYVEEAVEIFVKGYDIQ